MMKLEKFFIITLLMLIIILFVPKITYSRDVLTNPDGYKPTDQLTGGDATTIEQITSKLVTTLSNVGLVVSVVSIAIVGVKYMIGSTEEKAKYKENMMPYVVGIILIFGISSIVKALVAIGDKINA